MEFFVRQYYNATQIVLTALDKLLSENKPLTGENMHDTLFEIGKFQGLIPLEFKSNTATVPLDINVMKDGKDVTIKQMSSRLSGSPHAGAATAVQRDRDRLRAGYRRGQFLVRLRHDEDLPCRPCRRLYDGRLHRLDDARPRFPAAVAFWSRCRPAPPWAR